MILLGINTTANKTVAVLNKNGVFFCKIIPFAKHSENLFDAIEQLLKTAETSIKEVDVFGVVNGPGSFTGIRIGLAVVKTFAYVFNKPVAAVNSLEVLAYNKFDTKAESEFWCAIDAGAGLVYLQQFSNSLQPVTEPKCLAVQEAGDVVVAQEVLCPTPQVFDGGVRAVSADFTPEALHMALLNKYKAGAAAEPKNINPLYLRQSQAEVNCKPLQGGAQC